MRDCDNITFSGDAVSQLCDRCPGLRSIAILPGKDRSIDQALAQIAARCKALQVLDLSLCSSVYGHSILPVVQGCAQLTELDLECTRVGEEGLSFIAKYCKTLTRLQVSLHEGGSPVVEAFQLMSRLLSSFKGILPSGLLPGALCTGARQ